MSKRATVDRPSLRLLGAVLAGGRSRRLGRDKAAEPLGDTSMLERAVEALRESCGRVVVVSSRPETPEVGDALLPDLRDGGGPLCGIEAALAHAVEADFDGTVVLACDLPFAGPEVVRALVAGLGDADACAPVRGDAQGVEPLCAAYRTACLEYAQRLLDRGERVAGALFDAVDGVRIDLGPEPFLNVNTEADLARARRRVAAG